MTFLDSLRSHHFDILKEVGNIGAAHAATALSKLIDTKIEMNVPAVRLVSFQDLPETVGGAETEVVAIFLRFAGDASGSMFFLTSILDAERFVTKLIHKPFHLMGENEIEEMGISALHELGNILAGSYLSAFSDFTNLSLFPTVPQVSVDMAGAIVHYGVLTVSEVSDYAILIETDMVDVKNKQQPINGQFFFIPDPLSFEVIFRSLGVSIHE
ncbi:chemotaxis protein CheC [Alkalihalobacillus sp. 1P02AB]|uniref:chemotaxis protein CheC n=1 Tax=Alkalihalobacillus sp. 1P02AB TaxID=3132260 RepID=UPI0039A6922A